MWENYMPNFEHNIHIAAPPETVFTFLLDPETAHAVNPSVHEMTDIEEQDDGGYRAKMTYKLLAVKTTGTLEAVVVEPNEELVYRFDGSGLNGTLTWRLSERNGGTDVVEHGDYEMTGTVLDKVLEPVAANYNERQFQTAFENMKTYIEAQVAAPA
jgi:carbon monoxide dehydrogenase subunit G